MAQIKSLLGMMLLLFCFVLALVTGSPMRPPEGKFTPTCPGDFEITPMIERANSLASSVGSPSTAGWSADIPHKFYCSESSHHSHSAHWEHPSHTRDSTHGEHSAHSTHSSHAPQSATHSVPPPGYPERAVPLTASVDGATAIQDSQEFHSTSVLSTYGTNSAKMTHGPHTPQPHSAHSTRPLHTPHSTDGSHAVKPTHGEHSAHFTHGSHTAQSTRPAGHPSLAGDSGGPIPTLTSSVPHFLPTDEWWKREAREKKPTPITFNPSTLPTISTITFATGTECTTTMYLPHYPPNGPKTTTVWTSTSTFYPEFDCHGCATLTTVDPWTMGQPTTHYHHTKTIKSVLTVESPVCKPTSTL